MYVYIYVCIYICMYVYDTHLVGQHPPTSLLKLHMFCPGQWHQLRETGLSLWMEKKQMSGLYAEYKYLYIGVI